MSASAQRGSRWRYGCGRLFSVFVPRGFTYREQQVECGSTAYDGGVNQCERCARDPQRRAPPVPEYGDDLPLEPEEP